MMTVDIACLTLPFGLVNRIITTSVGPADKEIKDKLVNGIKLLKEILPILRLENGIALLAVNKRI